MGPQTVFRELPTYALFAALISFEPVRDGMFSDLVVCWFAERLPTDLLSHLVESVRHVDWNGFAADGDF